MSVLTLSVLPQRFAVCQLDADERIPLELFRAPFCSVTRTESELSIVVPAEMVPAHWKAESGWRALMVQGPLDFSLIGILASLSRTLAQAGVSIFAISTYDTDYLLVREADLERAIAVLWEEGHVIES